MTYGGESFRSGKQPQDGSVVQVCDRTRFGPLAQSGLVEADDSGVLDATRDSSERLAH